jgi:mRNA cleavage and polyadenylation factor CLP1 P-loop
MISNSGFPFAPDYLNSLRLGPQVEEVLPSKRKVSKARKIASTASVTKQVKKKAKIANNVVASSGAKLSVTAPHGTVVDVAIKQHLPVTMHTTAKSPESVLIPKVILKQEYPRNFGSCITAPSTCRFDSCCYSLIVTLSKDDIKTISGFCSLILLKGHISINGFSLKVGVETEIINPCWLPAVSLIPESSSPSSSTARRLNCIEVVRDILDSVGLTLKNNLSDPKMIEWINNSECLVLVRGVPRDRQEWLIAAEDQSLYQEYSRPLFPTNESGISSFLAENVCLQPKYWWTDTRTPGNNDVFGVTSAVIGSPNDIYRALGAELLDYPPCWVDSVDEIVKESSAEKCVSSRTVVCGAKGVGKSTSVRYVVNRLLSKTDAVAIIDCDLGQPEFTTPGLLSLHIITEPILSPSHMHIKQPLLSYFIGDITSKNEPELFAKALTALTAKYHKLQSELVKKKENLQRRNDAEVNSFSMLSDRKFKPRMAPLPLVVNTDGSIRFMGAEVLTAVMEIVLPTHVMHISSEKDRDLPAVNKLKGFRAEGHDTSHYCSSSSSSSTMSSGARSISNTSSNLEGEEEPTGCRVFTLEPGRLWPSKIHSVDLRTLR